MAYSVGQEVTLGNDAWTGHAPGERIWNVSGQKARVKAIDGNNVDFDFTPYGGGTGWGTMSMIAGAGGAPAPSPAPAAAGGGPRIDFANKQQSEIDKKRQALINYFKSLPSVENRFKGYLDEHGVTQQQQLVDALTGEIMSTTDRLEMVQDDVNDRSGDFIVTDAQARGIANRERQPIEEFLMKTMRNAEHASIGLQGKQQLVQQLLAMSLEDDERKAKPYEIDLDEQKSAAERLIAAFGGDQDSREAQAAAAVARAHDLMLQNDSQEHDFALENLSHQNQLARSRSTGSGGSSGAKTRTGAPVQSSTITKEVLSANQQVADRHWNDILATTGGDANKMKQQIMYRSSAYGTEGRDYLLDKLNQHIAKNSGGGSWF